MIEPRDVLKMSSSLQLSESSATRWNWMSCPRIPTALARGDGENPPVSDGSMRGVPFGTSHAQSTHVGFVFM